MMGVVGLLILVLQLASRDGTADHAENSMISHSVPCEATC